jgi:rod shape-determining protein MreB
MFNNFKNIFSGIFSGDIAIDLGTANTIVWIKGEGIVLNEPSVVARNIVDNKIIAVGEEAKQMIGRTNPKIETIRPLKDGVIADYKMTDAMIQGFMRKISRSRISRPRIVICIPSGVTDVEQRSVRESAEHANASEVHLIEEPMAAAIGIGIDVSKPLGNMIVDIGGGTTEIAVISLNGIGALETIKIAGDEQTLAIVEWFKSQHKLEVGERTAEDIKCNAGSAVRCKGINISVKGRDLITGIPKTIEISSDEIRQALAESVFQITTAIKKALDKTPPEHASDIIDCGIVLTGGGALLKDLDVHIRSKTGLPVHIAEDPLFSVVKGTGMVLDNIKKYTEVLINP